ncbi:hypothetical protein LXM94_21875 [Rhizobium sp. TRM95111]|uniref:hypothetical protein n=1 Tax=Rhizobium alarense TaxID=2846851 RepID=UPI001F176F78|nr:hypothetical protein [Rhizobium alarense]MCF3642624.1 hypothetical protein [Rhizobium alarense]
MDAEEQIDPRLFGFAPGVPDYDGFRRERRWSADLVPAAPATVLLDVKQQAADDPVAEMRAMLAEMTKELRERFQRLQGQRQEAEALAGDLPDETLRKAAQAEAKLAIEAISLIVRTLEKIDSLQRTLIAAEREAGERQAEPVDIDALAAEFETMIEEKAIARFERWKRDCGLADEGRAGSAAGTGEGENGP